MNTRPDTLEISFDMLIDVSPAEVPAGGAMMLRCAARATPKRDLRGKLVQVFDATGTIVGTLEFTGLEGATNTTEAVGFVAPAALGPQQWRAVISGVSEDAMQGRGASHDFGFEVVAHKTGLLVWGAPSAVAVGSEFAVTIGLKCSGGCAMTGHAVDIHDASGAMVARARMGEATLPGSTGLHQITLPLRAPAKISRQVWEARFAGDDRDLPHSPGVSAFSLNFVAAPEHRITISVRDAQSKAPIKGASVVAHPFRGIADAEGVATLQVASGSYTVWVSAPGHDPVCKYLDIAADHESVAELSPEIKEDPDAMYL
ncbi:MAG: carboxypeptidase-like regulatory domain-containing protein [Phaeovulum sp.]|jgi:hypothetical protein|uniref:carboxypeptidase-like regulatory domain-containing protein n=1 Tax=Phaeovulum sp. TaxID=2934796 RepID=UPI002731EBC9|nr:carboxypeptidase-like regulatory domain-containing protein [Phaeovulum sp.]MDP2063763.1 carboxypeptidase-like regulatory domain-containing protein [Phaeovulum sp.]